MAWWRYCAHADRPKVLTSVESKSNVDRIVAYPLRITELIKSRSRNNRDNAGAHACLPKIRCFHRIPTDCPRRTPTRCIKKVSSSRDRRLSSVSTYLERIPIKALVYSTTIIRCTIEHFASLIYESKSPGLVSPDREQGAWHPLVDNEVQGSFASRKLVDPRLHGSIEVYSNGGLQFEPNRDDPYWSIDHHPVERFQSMFSTKSPMA